jgi:hypothetical protein
MDSLRRRGATRGGAEGKLPVHGVVSGFSARSYASPRRQGRSRYTGSSGVFGTGDLDLADDGLSAVVGIAVNGDRFKSGTLTDLNNPESITPRRLKKGVMQRSRDHHRGFGALSFFLSGRIFCGKPASTFPENAPAAHMHLL